MTIRYLSATRRALMAGGCALLVTPPALAHRSQSVLTTVTWNAAALKLEVTHRLHAHDAEVGLAMVTGSATDVDLTIIKNQARLMLYVEQHFSLTGPTGVIALDPLGSEFEAELILLYREVKLPTPPSELMITDQILRDVFNGQTNLVNVRMATQTRTLLFTGKDGAKRAKDLL